LQCQRWQQQRWTIRFAGQKDRQFMFSFWLKVAVAFYGIASLAVVPAVLYDRPQWRLIALPTATLGVFFHFVSLVERMQFAHHTLPVNRQEVESVMGLLLVTGFLLVAGRYRTLTLGMVVVPAAFILTLLSAFVPGEQVFDSPLLRSGWIFFHIVMLLAAYAALFFSLMGNVLYLIQERSLKSKKMGGPMRWLPPLATMDQMAYRALLIGFPCMTAGLLAGSMIALEKYGTSYFDDPKVLLSYVLWGCYVCMIFIRRNVGIRGRRAVYLSAFVVVVAMAVFAANMFSSVHRNIAQ
jgi:ABC-type uncharacterized transport system permease subunit